MTLMSSPNIAKFLILINRGERTLTSLKRSLHFTNSTIHQYLQELKDANLIDFVKKGKEKYYFINYKELIKLLVEDLRKRFLEVLSELEFWEEAFNDDEKALKMLRRERESVEEALKFLTIENKELAQALFIYFFSFSTHVETRWEYSSFLLEKTHPKVLYSYLTLSDILDYFLRDCIIAKNWFSEKKRERKTSHPPLDKIIEAFKCSELEYPLKNLYRYLSGQLDILEFIKETKTFKGFREVMYSTLDIVVIMINEGKLSKRERKYTPPEREAGVVSPFSVEWLVKEDKKDKKLSKGK